MVVETTLHVAALIVNLGSSGAFDTLRFGNRAGSRMTEFDRLFSPIRLGNHTVKNRVVFSPHATGFGVDRRISDQHRAYYGARAEGGVGLIISEQNTVHPAGSLPKWLSAEDDSCIPELRKTRS